MRKRRANGDIRDYMLEITYAVYASTGYDSSVALFVPDPFQGHRTHSKAQSMTIFLSMEKNSSYTTTEYRVTSPPMQIIKVARLICCVVSNRCIPLHPQCSHVLSLPMLMETDSGKWWRTTFLIKEGTRWMKCIPTRARCPHPKNQ